MSSQVLQKDLKTGVRLDRLPPAAVMAVALVLAFLVFVCLDCLEQTFLNDFTVQQMRAFHFVRGFLATAGGMSFVWLIMRRKEIILKGLRDKFAQALEERTLELNKALTDRERQRERLDAILASMADGLIEMNEFGTVMSVNRGFERQLGLTQTHLLEKKATDLAALFASAPGSMSILEALANPGVAHADEAFYEHPSGKRLILHWTCAPINSDFAEKGVVLTFTDLTETRRLQEDLSFQREDFLSVINHRLRTPVLANIRANALLLENAFGALSNEQQQIVRAMQDNSQDIDRLLNMLMDICRYKNNHKVLRRERHSVASLVEESVSHLRKKVEARRLTLNVHDGAINAKLRVDRQELLKLLGHLSDNAVKHARSSVTFSADVEDGKVQFSIRDDGTGLAQEDIPQLFTRFFQLSSGGRYAPVTGTGLCLCAEIARAHGGHLSCESEPGTGTCFILKLDADL